MMSAEPSEPTTIRTWQAVARERGMTLQMLADYLGRPYGTVRHYSSNKRRMPHLLLVRLSVLFGESVR